MKDKKTALVLSGGGAKGAFQVGAEKYAREKKGYSWSLIAGVSVGALNGALLGMKKYERLEQIWNTIHTKDISAGSLNLWTVVQLLFGKTAVYDETPLWNIIDAEIDPKKITVDLRIGAVSLRTGQYTIFKPSDPGFKKAILASAAKPIVWKPVTVSRAYPDMIDGGMRTMSPLGDVLDAEPDEVVIINCNPRETEAIHKPFRNILDIGRRSLDIAFNEIFKADLREFLRINYNVKEAARKSISLHNERGKLYKQYECRIIEPDKPLGRSMDFSREAIVHHWKAGWKKAKEILG